MARTQIKLLVFLITMGLAFGCAVGAWSIYNNLLSTKFESNETKSAKVTAAPRPPPDPGIRRFETAVEFIRGNKISEGRDALYKLLFQFPNSPTCTEAKRILGEINMDALYAFDQSAGKKDYIVQPGNSLLAIAGKNHTTVEAIARLNGLNSINLRVGDHLFLIPTNFDAVVDVSSLALVLRSEGKFFKEYKIEDLKLPPNTRVPSTMEVANKSAVFNNASVNPVSPDFVTAEKRVVLNKVTPVTAENPVGRVTANVGLLIRALPKAAEVVDTPPPPASKSKKPSKKKDDDDDTKEVEDTTPTSQTGLFLKHDDMEELYLLLRRTSRFEIKP
jgi:LysM repeat protein